MRDLCMVRVINAESEEKAKLIVDECCVELCSQYNTTNYGIDVVREINASKFLSIFYKKEISDSEVEKWINEDILNEIHENYAEDGLDDEMYNEFKKLWGEEFVDYAFINYAEAYYKDDTKEWMLKLHFDICPATCMWDGARRIDGYDINSYDEKMNIIQSRMIEWGKTSEISAEFKKEEIAYAEIIIDAKKEKNEYGVLLPVWSKVSEGKYRLSIDQSFNDYPEMNNDYVFFLDCKF